jgi:hypothetical protein
MSEEYKSKYKKKTIPAAMRRQVWIRDFGKDLIGRCYTCQKEIDAFDFDCGHNFPEVAGGPTSVSNLVVQCSKCNRSQPKDYTADRFKILMDTKSSVQETILKVKKHELDLQFDELFEELYIVYMDKMEEYDIINKDEKEKNEIWNFVQTTKILGYVIYCIKNTLDIEPKYQQFYDNFGEMGFDDCIEKLSKNYSNRNEQVIIEPHVEALFIKEISKYEYN